MSDYFFNNVIKQKKRRRSRTISKLREINDPLIGNFKEEELLPITIDNGYHSPEFSEEEEEENKENKITVRNMWWRSSTVSQFIKLFI